MVSNTRLYGAAIAVVSGIYSLGSASAASRMVASAWVMTLLGVIVIGHGVLLVSSLAPQLGSLSGPLMIGYSIVMLVNQGLLGSGMVDSGHGMGMDGGMGASGMTAGMGWDAGMVALAVLMLVSGVIMLRNRDMAQRGM